MKGKKGYGHFGIVKCGKVSIELLNYCILSSLLDITGEKIEKIEKIPEMGRVMSKFFFQERTVMFRYKFKFLFWRIAQHENKYDVLIWKCLLHLCAN